jgi:porin
MSTTRLPYSVLRRFFSLEIFTLAAAFTPWGVTAQTIPVAVSPDTSPSSAQVSPGVGPQAPTGRTYMLGDWNGERKRLEDEGILFRSHYQSESAAAGSYGARYTQQVDIGTDLDLGKLWGWDGSSFHMTIGDRVGRNLSADRLHSIVQVQEIYGVGQDARLYEMSYEYVTPGKGFDVKAGWMPLGNEFGHSTIACQFESLFFCGHPLTMSFDSGWYNNPKASWGFRTKWSNDLVYGMVGTYTTNPTYPEANHGFKLNLSGTTGVVVPLEFGLTPGKDTGVMPGHYMVGAYYDSSDANNVYLDKNGLPIVDTHAKPMLENHRTGYYLIADQMIWQDGDNLKRGISVFADFSQSDLATSRYRRAYEVGFSMQAPFESRPLDVVVLGAARLTVNPRVIESQQDENWMLPDSVGVQSYEQVIEAAYSWQGTKWFSLRPGVQYLQRPGALASRDRIWISELTAKLTF